MGPVEKLIHIIRGQKVMLDSDLAPFINCERGALKDMKALPPPTNRKIGFRPGGDE